MTYGKVGGYDSDSTEFIIEAFEMDKELAEYFRGQLNMIIKKFEECWD